MQLSQESVRGALGHEDPVVRALVHRWFEDKSPHFWPRSEELIRAYDAYGLANICDLQPQSCDDPLVSWLLQESLQDFKEARLRIPQAQAVWNWLLAADLELIEKRLPEIRSAVDSWHTRHPARHAKLELVTALEARLAAAQLGPEKCWELLPERLAVIAELADEMCWDEYRAASAALEPLLEIAARADIGAAVLERLTAADPHQYGYELIAYLRLATRLKLEAAAPIAIKLTAYDWEELLETIEVFLRTCSNPSVQALVSQHFEKVPWEQQLYLRGACAADYSPEAAAYARRHLQIVMKSKNGERMIPFALDVALLFCSEDMDCLHDLYRKHQSNPKYVELAQCLQMLNELGGLQDPRDANWKAAPAIAQQLRQEEFAGQKSVVSSRGSSPTKAGRNDRCPCGSGKKYKQCCWNS